MSGIQLGTHPRVGPVPGLLSDVVAMKGDPTQHIEAMQDVQFVMKGGKIYKRP